MSRITFRAEPTPTRGHPTSKRGEGRQVTRRDKRTPGQRSSRARPVRCHQPSESGRKRSAVPGSAHLEHALRAVTSLPYRHTI